MNRVFLWLVVAALALSPLAQASLDAQQPATESADKNSADDGDRDERLAKYLTGVKFVGMFRIDGKEDAPGKVEEYTISKCEKLPKPNTFRMTARIKYGDVDSEVPLELTILWSGKTPVITLDSFWIPGMGTFDARVLIHSNRYAGTWQHGKVGGVMFGKIVKD